MAEAVAKSADATDPKLAELCAMGCGAFQAAAGIARELRSRTPTTGVTLAMRFITLSAWLGRYDQMRRDAPDDLAARWERWPTTPTATMGPCAGASALAVGVQFARWVYRGVDYAARAAGLPMGSKLQELRIEDSPILNAWRTAAVTELNTKTLPPPEEWKLWAIRRDAQTLEAQIVTESRQIGTSVPKRTASVNDAKVSKAAKLNAEARALAVLTQHLDWSDVQIADAAGVSRSHLYRLTRYVAARRMQKADRERLPKGRKDRDTGKLEAW